MVMTSICPDVDIVFIISSEISEDISTGSDVRTWKISSIMSL